VSSEFHASYVDQRILNEERETQKTGQGQQKIYDGKQHEFHGQGEPLLTVIGETVLLEIPESYGA
jgi:hypothetical protein